jgi:phosphoribosylamine--glycine ligase
MSRLTVLVIGSGGREHALAWGLAHSDSVGAVHAAPGNPGMAALGPVHAVSAGDAPGILDLVRTAGIDLVVVGPEQPLADGLADRLREASVPVFGPGAAGARLEASKAFSKAFMQSHGIPTARFAVASSESEARRTAAAWGAPLVVKASGLAAGKGVFVADTEAEVDEALTACFDARAFGDAGGTVVLEEKLTGEEASVFVVTDGDAYHLFPASQDHKRAFDGDAGPNTGGMGAYSPAPVMTPAMTEHVEETVIRPVLDGLRRDGIAYRGLLYVGLMLTETGPQVLEFNVRFGDPETQAVLPRLGWDLGTLFLDTARGRLSREPLPPPRHPAAACVVAAGADYPRSGSRGAPITGIPAAEATGALVFHAGTAAGTDGTLVTAGGRVLNVVARGDTLRGAVDAAYAAVEAIHFEGMRFRRDIGHRALGPAASRT